MTGTLKQIGGSLAVIIPKAMAEGFVAGEKIELTEHDGGILLTRPKARTRRPIGKIVEQMNSAAYAKHNRTLLGDTPVGKEAW